MPQENQLSSEYSKLLSYLESQSRSGSQPSVVKKIGPPSVVKQPEEDKELKIVKLVGEPKIEDFDGVYGVDLKGLSSGGFDVGKFESLMRSKLIDDHKRLQSYERPYISVGEICSCIRRGYYNRQKYPVDIKRQFSFSYLYLIQKVGNLIHEVVQNLYDFAEVEKTVVSEKFKVKGRADALKNEFLYEIKSLDPEKYHGDYVKAHYHQALIYAYILNSEYNYNIEKISILYVLRNLKKIYPFDLPVNDDLASSFLKRSLLLRSSLTSKQIPEPVGASEEECRFCLYRSFCEKDQCEVLQPFKDKNVKKEPVFLM